MLARIFPGVIPPTLGTASLVEVAPAAFGNPYNYSYRVDITVTITGSAPPGSAGWGVYVSAGATNTLFNGSASTAQTLSLGVNNLQITLNTGALPSYYLRVEVYTQDPFGNIAIIQRSSNTLQMPARKKLYATTYADTQTSFTHPSGVSTYDVFFTSKGGNGSGEIPGAQCWGGGGAGVRINGLSVDGATYHVDTRTSQTACYIRRTSAGNTADQILANNGADATVSPYNDGTGATSATLAGFFAGGTLITNAGGQTGSTPVGGGSATVLGGRSGIHSGNNPVFSGQDSSSSGGLTGLVDVDGDNFADFTVFGALAYGCGGYSVTFPGGSPTFGTGQSGCVQILYYE